LLIDVISDCKSVASYRSFLTTPEPRLAGQGAQEKALWTYENRLAYMTAKELLLGTSNPAITTINEELDFMGASLDDSTNRGYATPGLRVLKKELDKGFAIFRDDLTQSTRGLITRVEYCGLVLDYQHRYPLLISAVTRQEVLPVAKAYLHPENYLLVVAASL
jgi:predicted Zn-dependent peptidase